MVPLPNDPFERLICLLSPKYLFSSCSIYKSLGGAALYYASANRVRIILLHIFNRTALWTWANICHDWQLTFLTLIKQHAIRRINLCRVYFRVESVVRKTMAYIYLWRITTIGRDVAIWCRRWAMVALMLMKTTKIRVFSRHFCPHKWSILICTSHATSPHGRVAIGVGL